MQAKPTERESTPLNKEKIVYGHKHSEAEYTIQQILKPNFSMREESIFHRSGIYQLTCLGCGKKHTGQTRRNF
jgi:hypothetical protein